MSFVLPLVALALAVLSRLAFADRSRSSERPTTARLVCFAATVAIGAVLANRFGPKTDTMAADCGILLGSLVALAAVWLPEGALALGVAGAASLHLLKPEVVGVSQLAFISAAGLGALTLSSASGPELAALAAIFVAAADNLCARHFTDAAGPTLGSVIGLTAAVGVVLAGFLKGRHAVVQTLLVVAAVMAGTLFATKSLTDKNALTALAIGAAAAIVLHALLYEEAPDAVRVGIGTTIAICVATLGYGLGHGAGMALCLISCGGILAALGNSRALLVLGPLLGLVLYRVLREAHPDVSRALDIGQHYALIGISLGVVVPIAMADWLRRANHPWKGSAGTFLLALLGIGIPGILILILGDKGIVGFVVGLGLTGMMQALRGESRALTLSLAGGLAGITILVSEWATGLDELERAGKVRVFEEAFVALVLIVALVAWLGRPEKEEAKS